jgi:putative tricarboxylic transport membrane protein
VQGSIRNPKDFWAGILFVAVGLAAVGLIRSHPMGTTMRMGPAYFPTVLGGLAILIGLAAMLRGCARPGPPIGRLALGRVAIVTAAIVGFGVLLRPLGLAAAIVQLVLLSAAASRYFRWPVALALSVGLAAGSSLVFARLLGLPIPILGTWLGG